MLYVQSKTSLVPRFHLWFQKNGEKVYFAQQHSLTTPLPSIGPTNKIN